MDVTNKYNTDGTSDFDNGVKTNCNNVIISDLNNDVTKKKHSTHVTINLIMVKLLLIKLT